MTKRRPPRRRKENEVDVRFIVEGIIEATGYREKLVDEVVENLLVVLYRGMCKGNNIYIRHFGSFMLREYKGRKHNIGCVSEDAVRPRFKPSVHFKKQVRNALK